MKTEHSDIPLSLRKRVFKLLKENSMLKPKQLCKLLGENYGERGEVVTQYRKQWKKEYQSQRGSIRSVPNGLHNVFYKGKLEGDLAEGILCFLAGRYNVRGEGRWLRGWKPTRAKNRYWVFRCGEGRIRFFESGTVEIWVKKPASLGKAKGVFCRAFVDTELIDSLRVCRDFYAGLMRKMHATFDYGEKLPYMKITAFEKTHGFTLVTGDKSHPTCAEFMFEYHEEVFEARRLFDSMRSFFDGFSGVDKGPKPLENDYSS